MNSYNRLNCSNIEKEDQNSISEVIFIIDNIQNLNSVKRVEIYLLYVTIWTELT